MDVGLSSPRGWYGMLVFHAIHCDTLKCDLSGQWGVVHRRSVPPPHPPSLFAGKGEIPLISISTSSPAVSTRRLLPSFIAARMALPRRMSLCWSRPCSRLAETLLLTSLQVSADIHELWHATHLYGFGIARHNSANVLFSHIPV